MIRPDFQISPDELGPTIRDTSVRLGISLPTARKLHRAAGLPRAVGRPASQPPPVERLRGLTLAEIAERFHVSQGTAHKWRKFHGVSRHGGATAHGNTLPVPSREHLEGVSGRMIAEIHGVCLGTAQKWKRTLTEKP